jgi:BirA family biotin operon repressor/biotin-[acetyl-CoA-carboxylase] ligase
VSIDDRELLVRLGRGACGGPELAAMLGLGRAAVWKRIEALRHAGVPIVAVQGRGYTLDQPIELLDADAIGAALQPVMRAQAGSLEILWEIDSTNAELLRRPPGHATEILFAERQTQGRGRRGRNWITPLGAQLAFSLRRRFDGGVAALAGLSLAVGVAVAEGLNAAGYADVGLKWPNDLVCNERKLGGILIEFGGEYAGPVRAVIGIGINTALPDAAATAIDQPWTDLQRIGSSCMNPDGAVARNAVAAALLDALLPALELFATDGLAPFLPRWNRLDALRGREIDVLIHGRRKRGTVLGIGDDGALRVRHAGGEHLYHSAEVSVRRLVEVR